jgi:TolA-binding protein
MRTLLLLTALLICPFLSHAQVGDTTRIGKIVYYEGKVEIGTENKWSVVKIGAPVRKNQWIKTTGDGMAEISWSNGKKSVVGPNSKIGSQALFASLNNGAKKNTEGVFTGFNKVFQENTTAKRSEEGGIRRSETEVRASGGDQEVYWKEDKEISFEEAYDFYSRQDYGKAIAGFHAFLNQKPNDDRSRVALFALGHAYIMADNSIKAKEIFERFIALYPTDALKSDAEKVISQL